MTDEIKSGNRNNAGDRGTIRKLRQLANEIVSHTMQLEPLDVDPTPEPSEITEFPLDPEKSFVGYGGAVKALGDGKVGGYLVRYSTDADPDLSGEYFTGETDFGEAEHVPVFYHHGQDARLKLRKIGRATLRRDEVGIWAETQLALRDEYEQMIYAMAEDGKLGYSSGAIGHVTEYEQTGKATRIKTWLIGEASLTPTPAEPRNSVIPLKSLGVITQDTEPEQPEGQPEAGDTAAVKALPGEEIEINLPTTKEGTEMEITQEILDQLLTKAVGEAVKAVKASEPAPDTAGRIEVTLDEADRPFQSIAEMAKAVKSAAVNPARGVDPRLAKIATKATGANEGIETQGGYLVDPTLVSFIMKPIHEQGPFSSRVNRLPVGNNSNYGWINGVDETSRATGSRWGGVRGYWVAEAGTLTSSKPAFRRINWELKDLGALMYATDDLLNDVSQFQAIAQQSVGEELNFLVNDAIFEGDGLGKPLGILNSGALIEAGRDTASHIYHADILGMWSRLLPRSRANAAWFVNSLAEVELNGLYMTSTLATPYVSYGPDGVMKVMGRPVIVNEFGEALNSKGDILLADMSEYLFWEKGGVNSASSIHLAFTTNETAFRWIYRCDGQTSMSSAVTTFKGSSTQSAFVCLEAAT